jgi:hypothetical protein
VSTSLRSRIRQVCLLGCVSGAALFALAGQASAATTVSVAVDSTFDGGQEGWTAAANEQNSLLGGPLCIEGVTCPSVTDERHATGGVEKSGYIETKEGGLLSVGLLAESTGTWESPAFTYLGVGGQLPTNVEFTLARRAQLANLLSLPGAQATYTVELVDKSSPSGSVVVTNAATLSGTEEWKAASTSISPSLLVRGDDYKVRIRTSFVTPVALVPAGGVGYDEVGLTASIEESQRGPEGRGGSDGSDGSNGSNGKNGTDGAGGSSGSNGSGGSNGTNGADGSGTNGNGGVKGVEGNGGGLSDAGLRSLIASSGLPGTATLQRGRLVVTGTCPKSIPGACTVRIRGMLNRHRAATTSGRAKIANGGRHRFTVAFRPSARRQLRQVKQILVKEWVRAGSARAVVYKRLKVVER